MRLLAALLFTGAIAGSGVSFAQSQSHVPLYVGEITSANAERFTTTLSEHVDQVVGLKIDFDTIREGNTLTDGSSSGGAYISYATRYGGVQINIPDAYWRHGRWIVDGFYTIKYGGVGQGILGYFLRPADEAVIRLLEKPIVEQPVWSLLPVEP